MTATTPPVKVVWSDFGGVLTPPIEQSLTAFCTRHGVTKSDLRAAMITVGRRYGVTDPLAPLDIPLVGEDEWLRQVSAELGGALQLTSLADAWFDGRATNIAWVRALEDLRRTGVSVGLLSNMVPTWDAHWRRMVDADALFDHIVLSFEAGHRKPDHEMYELAASRAGVHPSQCVLVDDLEKNCLGAQAAGWQYVHFTDAGTAADRLARLLA